jgi:putative ABC transport system substrate-binding protein
LTFTRRSVLGLLGGAATGVLLVPLLACRRQGQGVASGHTGRLHRIGMLQYVDAPPANATRAGFVEGMAAQGFEAGRQLQLRRRVAGGSARRCRQLADQLVDGGLDLLVAIGTPPLLAALAEAPNSLPIVFCYCSNPWGAGAGRSATDHRAHVTGTVTTNPVADQLRLARRLVPGLQRVGLLYNPAEPNASFEAELMAQAAARLRLTLLREPVAAVNDLAAGFERLRRLSLQALLQVGDYISQQGFAQLAALALGARIPLIGVDPAFAAVPGCLAVVGWDPFSDGRVAGAMAARVLRGTPPAQIPFAVPGEPGLWLNPQTARGLGIVLPADLVAQAQAIATASSG